MGDESNITKQAIDELLKDVNSYKEYSSNSRNMPERKINPLIKPNKRFLDRTLSSMLSHNKRESERTRKLCQRKLRHLDRKHRKRKYQNLHTKGQKKITYSHNSSSCDSYTSTSRTSSIKNKPGKQKKKTRIKKQFARRISITSETSSKEENQNANRLIRYRKCSMWQERQKENQLTVEKTEKLKQTELWNNDFYENTALQTLNTASYSHHMSLWWAKRYYHDQEQQKQQQQTVEQQRLLNGVITDSSDSFVSSDLRLNSTSDVSLNISLSSSSEENNKGEEILTYDVSSSSLLSSSDNNENNEMQQKDNCIVTSRSHISLSSSFSEEIENKHSSNMTSIILISSDSDSK